MDSIPGLCSVGSGSGAAMSCGVGHRRGSALVLLWLWGRPTATAPIRPLAWELPCAAYAALKRKICGEGCGEKTLFYLVDDNTHCNILSGGDLAIPTMI